jgi:hypothetical protein
MKSSKILMAAIIAGAMLMLTHTAGATDFYNYQPDCQAVPEIDPASLASMATLVIGGLALLTARRAK